MLRRSLRGNQPPSLYWGSACGRIAERIIIEIENSDTFEDLRTALDGCEILIKVPLTAKIRTFTENEVDVYFDIDKETAFSPLPLELSVRVLPVFTASGSFPI
jgi:hypothetical protein